MGQYEQKLYKYVHSKGEKGFIRLFRGKCPECGERIFNTNEKFEDSKIFGYFNCNCGKSYKQVMYSQDSKKYRFKQGIVKNYKRKNRSCRGVDMSLINGKVYLIMEDKIVVLNKDKG